MITFLNIQMSMKNEADALKSVQNGQTMGYLVIPFNYTDHLKNRFVQNIFADNETLSGSSIKVRLDNSSNFSRKFNKLKE